MSSKRAELRITLQDQMVRCEAWQTCLNCFHWQRESKAANLPDGCSLFGYAMPPPHIIVSGCKDHEFDIPF